MNKRYMIVGLLALVTAGYSTNSESQRLAPAEMEPGDDPYAEALTRYQKKAAPKIVDGKIALDGAHPWQVSLGVASIADPYWAHFCGGSIYSSTWIVTAAHCAAHKPDEITIMAGTNRLVASGQRLRVKRIVVNSAYNRRTKDNDIAILELASPLVLGDRVKPLPLVARHQETTALSNGPLVVTGWGATQQDGDAVRELRYLEVPFVESTECDRSLAYDGRITSNMLCAGYSVGGKDSCQGDSGGPLSARVGASMLQVGVVSWGDGCAIPNRVGVYTRVANYHSWIAACVANSSECK